MSRKPRTTFGDAVLNLMVANRTDELDELARYRDKNGRHWGWDGWFRKRFPDLVDVVWP